MNLRILVLNVFLLSSSLLQAADPLKLAVENYKKIAIGSNLEFVYECLGKQSSISFHDGVQKTLKWETKDVTVVIRFRHNRVTEKWHSELSAANEDGPDRAVPMGNGGN